MAQINLLPPEYRARRRGRRVIAIATAAGAVVLVFLGIVLLIQRNSISSEEDELRNLQDQAANLRTQVAELQEFGDLKDEIDRKEGVLASALTNDVAWSKFLNDLSLIIPDDSWLTNLSLSAVAGEAPSGVESFGTVTFQGFVFDFPGLAGWLTRTSQIDGLTFLYLTNGTKQEISAQEVVSFGANANVTEALLSKRCQEDNPCP